MSVQKVRPSVLARCVLWLTRPWIYEDVSYVWQEEKLEATVGELEMEKKARQQAESMVSSLWSYCSLILQYAIHVLKTGGLVSTTVAALAVDNAASEQLNHSKWPPVVYVKVKCHFTAEIVHVLNSSSSFGDIILNILNFPQLKSVCFAMRRLIR